MKKKTTVSIYDMDFTLVGDESEAYVRKVASLVDSRVREVADGSGLSTVAAVILASVNIADDYCKALDSADAMRQQLREYFEEISRLKDENAELRRSSKSRGRGRAKTDAESGDADDARQGDDADDASDGGSEPDKFEDPSLVQLELDK